MCSFVKKLLPLCTYCVAGQNNLIYSSKKKITRRIYIYEKCEDRSTWKICYCSSESLRKNAIFVASTIWNRNKFTANHLFVFEKNYINFSKWDNYDPLRQVHFIVATAIQNRKKFTASKFVDFCMNYLNFSKWDNTFHFEKFILL